MSSADALFGDFVCGNLQWEVRSRKREKRTKKTRKKEEKIKRKKQKWTRKNVFSFPLDNKTMIWNVKNIWRYNEEESDDWTACPSNHWSCVRTQSSAHLKMYGLADILFRMEGKWDMKKMESYFGYTVFVALGSTRWWANVFGYHLLEEVKGSRDVGVWGCGWMEEMHLWKRIGKGYGVILLEDVVGKRGRNKSLLVVITKILVIVYIPMVVLPQSSSTERRGLRFHELR